jgi:hypothetical protein
MSPLLLTQFRRLLDWPYPYGELEWQAYCSLCLWFVWKVANLSKLVECCKCSSWNLLALWRFSIPAALWWKLDAGEQHFLKGSNNESWWSFSGNVCTTVAIRHMVTVGIPEKPPLSRLSSDYSNPVCVEEDRLMLRTGRICSACPLYTVSKSMKSNKDNQLQFHLRCLSNDLKALGNCMSW